MTTLLSFCTEALDEIGVVAPSSIVGSIDLTAKRMLACANSGGRYMLRHHNWSILAREHEITTTQDVSNYAVPDDFERLTIGTAWDRTQFWQMRGGKTPQQWQRLRSSLISSADLRRSFRVMVGPLTGSILIDPTPSATGDALVVEYVSKNWCESSGGTGQSAFAADTDLIRIDEDLFRLELLWRARRALGMSYADERNDALMALNAAIKADIAIPNVDLTAEFEPFRHVPDGSWPGS